MTDPSMFPDLFPDFTPSGGRRPESCCDGLVAPIGVPRKVWTYTHALAHSRVPFTAAGFVTAADCTEHEAGVAIRQACQRDWLDPVLPESYMREPIPQWVGRLPRRR